ncbi:MAG: DUF4145 domain-containing protein [Yoonia sp.]
MISVGRVSAHHTKVIGGCDWRTYSFVVCDNCERASLISFHVNTGWEHLFRDFEKNDIILSTDDMHDLVQFPKRDLSCPKFLPELVQQTYMDAEFNYSAERWKTSAQLYLQAMEFGCISLKTGGDVEVSLSESANKIDLTSRINDLYKSGKLTESMKEWAHQIRVIGQYHKHRYVEASEQECSELRGFVDMFLQYSFTMPGLVEARRDRLSNE